jgi:serine/threonine-protein kinase
MKKNPVTNLEYLRFLNDLLDQGREEDALRYAPRDRGVDYSGIIYGRDKDGRFILQPDLDGDLWDLDWPVILVNWNSAMAYAQWFSQKTNRHWRLPYETEWEKAARGVDGRIFPWGDYFNPAWCSMRNSKNGRPFMSDIYEHPIDCSPYGVMGMAGNIREWTATAWSPEGPTIRNNRCRDTMPTFFDGLRVTIKGGSWYDPDIYCRAGSRVCAGVIRLDELLGFRLVSPMGTSR